MAETDLAPAVHAPRVSSSLASSPVPPAPLVVAGIQCSPAWEDRATNLARLAPRVEAAAAGGAALVVLPEMFASGFSMDTTKVAEPLGGPTEAWLRALAERTGAAVAGSDCSSITRMRRPATAKKARAAQWAICRRVLIPKGSKTATNALRAKIRNTSRAYTP
jgi:predicted amidohydrolase